MNLLVSTLPIRQRHPGALLARAWRGAAVVALAWAGVAGAAAAADVYWSIGIQQPGVQVVVGQPQPAPVVLVPTHRVVVVPPPVYRASWVPPGHARHVYYPHRHGYGRHDAYREHWKDERRHRHDEHRRHEHPRDPWHGQRR